MPSNAGINVAEEPFHRRVTVVENFGSKSALIEIRLSSIHMLVSVTVNSVNNFLSFTTAYSPGKTFANEVSLGHTRFFLRLASSDRPKFLAFSKKKQPSNDVVKPFFNWNNSFNLSEK